MKEILRALGTGFAKLKLGDKTGEAKLINYSRTLQIKPETEPNKEWYQKPFRLLSADLIVGHWLDISEEVLKRALSKFEGITVFANHNDNIMTWLGKVDNTKWEKATGDVPAGVNGLVNINIMRDTKLGGDLVIGLDNGIITHGSIGFWFNWIQSHPELDTNTFWNMLGTEVEDKIVSIIITEITDVSEFSLVSYGADRYAVSKEELNIESELVSPSDTTKKQQEEEKLEVKMNEKIIELCGLKAEATDSEVLAVLSENKYKAELYNARVKAIRDKALADVVLLKNAKIELPEGIEETLKTCPENVLTYLVKDFEAKLKVAIPEGGRSSQPPKEIDVSIQDVKEPLNKEDARI